MLLSRCEAKLNQISRFLALLRRWRVSMKMLAQIADLYLCDLTYLSPYVHARIRPSPFCLHPYVGFRPERPQGQGRPRGLHPTNYLYLTNASSSSSFFVARFSGRVVGAVKLQLRAQQQTSRLS